MRQNVRCIYKDEFGLVDEFLSANFSSPTHWKDWNIPLSRHYNTEFFYFGFYKDEKLTGICPIHKIKNKMNYRLISGPKEFYMPFGGWIFSEEIIFESSFLNLKYNESLEIFTLPVLREFKAKYEGYKLLKMHSTAILNLERSEEEIWDGLPSQRRNKIRKAIKNNIRILTLDDVGLERFYDFYVFTNKQYGLKSLSPDFFKDLILKSKNINTDIIISEYNSEINGAVVTVSDKNYSIYWLGARLESSANTGFFDFLQWEAIKNAKSRGCRFYDLCYLEKDRLPGINKFKTDYSDSMLDVLNINYKPVTYRFINKIQKIF
jgi:lipid II:glycine glycyltransferase (peptidoglycan interpeptide bridge formation enzyme)